MLKINLKKLKLFSILFQKIKMNHVINLINNFFKIKNYLKIKSKNKINISTIAHIISAILF